jgi:hypothetical protein
METKITNILTELEDSFYDIPFGNSAYQNKMFVINASYTPARAYRSIGLQLIEKINAIRENIIATKLNEIDIEELQEKLLDENLGKFDRRRMELDLIKKTSGKKWVDKMMNDALKELDSLYVEFVKYPKYTRELFEIEESHHFDKRFVAQLETRGNGSLESILQVQSDPIFEKQLLDVKEVINQLDDINKIDAETIKRINFIMDKPLLPQLGNAQELSAP